MANDDCVLCGSPAVTSLPKRGDEHYSCSDRVYLGGHILDGVQSCPLSQIHFYEEEWAKLGGKDV